VGFCFYIRRKALEDVGFFDEESFGRGYGEENDFCFRVKKAGWKNLHALDAYVYHHGETSFAESASASQFDGLRALAAKHPEYLSEIDSFIKQDPARHARRRIDIERIKQSIPNDCAIFFSHDWGGGIEKHVNDLSDLLAEQGIDVILLHSIRGETTHFGIKKLNNSIYLPNLNNIDINDAGELLEQFLGILKPRFLHIHSLIGFNKSSRSIVTSVIGSSGIPYFYTFHDYTPICQHAQFVRPDRQYCGEPDVATCQKCVDQFKPYFGRENVLEYQNNYRDFLLGASGLIAPSVDTQSRANRFLNIKRCDVIEHFQELKINVEPSHTFCASKKKVDSEVRVAILGAIGPHKGNDVILACQADALSRKLPISYMVIGYCDKKELGGIRMSETGPYSDIKDAIHEINEFAPTLIFYPSIWPETFSYTLSVAFMLNIPPLVFDLGATAERVRRHSFGKVIPSRWIKSIQQINDFILSEEWNPLHNADHKKMIDLSLTKSLYITIYKQMYKL
jgi:glycosyltransferase involved in cell wall biosynthesis